MPRQSVVTTGSPLAIASSTGMPHASYLQKQQHDKITCCFVTLLFGITRVLVTTGSPLAIASSTGMPHASYLQETE
jgi:hypothetical protein